MAKFKSSHLKLKTNQRVYFGDADQASFTYDGTDLITDVPVRGERAIQQYHLVRYDQLTEASGILQQQIDDLGLIDWQDSVSTISGTPPGSPSDEDRYLIADSGTTGVWVGHEDDIAEWSTASGTWIYTDPNSGFATYVEDEDKVYIYDGSNWSALGFTIDHGNLQGLGDDDHIQYILVDGSRGFTNTVSGIDPVQAYHLATKQYIDDEIATVTGTVGDHGVLNGLDDDDHTQYPLVDGSRGFTNTVSGVTPVEDYHLATKGYVDDQFTTISGNRKWGRVTVISGAYSQAVTFNNNFSDDDYTLVASLTNEIDSPPSIYSTIQGVKTSGGFTTHFSGEIDTINFILEWIAEYGQQS